MIRNGKEIFAYGYERLPPSGRSRRIRVCGQWYADVIREDQKLDEAPALTSNGKTPADYGDNYVVVQ